MNTSIEISQLKGKSQYNVLSIITSKFEGILETLDKNIHRFVFNQNKELNAVTIYSSCGIVHKISYGYNH